MMKKLILITRPTGSEFSDHWSDIPEKTKPFFEVYQGSELIELDDETLFQQIFKKELSKGSELGILVHSEDLLKRLKEIKNTKDGISFVRRYGTQQDESYRLVEYFNDKSYIYQLEAYCENIERVKETIQNIWNDNAIIQKSELIHVSREFVGIEKFPYKKILIIGNSENEEYYKTYFLEVYGNIPFVQIPRIEVPVTRSKEQDFPNQLKLIDLEREGIYFHSFNSESLSHSPFPQKVYQSFDLIAIEENLILDGVNHYGYELANQILVNSQKKELNLVILNQESQEDIIRKTNDLTRNRARILSHWHLPFRKGLPFVKMSPLKWQAIQLSNSQEGLVRNWLHDIEHINSLEKLKAFCSMLSSYGKLISKDVHEIINDVASCANNNYDGLKSRIIIELNRMRKQKIIVPKLTENVLLVEDDENQRELLSTKLQEYFASVTSTGSGAEALQLIEDKAFGIVIADLQLLVTPNDVDSPLQEIWGIEIIEKAYEKKLIPCILTAQPKASVEALLEANSGLKGEVFVLYKQIENDYMPAHYAWVHQLERLRRKVALRNAQTGFKGKWGKGKEYIEHYKKLEADGKLELFWDTIQKRLASFDYDISIISFGRPGDNNESRPYQKTTEIITRVIMCRILLASEFEQGSITSWKEFKEEVFNVEIEYKKNQDKNINTYLGFSLKNSRIDYSGLQFEEEKEILLRLSAYRAKIEINQLVSERVLTLIQKMGEATDHFDEEDLDTQIVNYQQTLEIIDTFKELLKDGDNYTTMIYDQHLKKYISPSNFDRSADDGLEWFFQDLKHNMLEWEIYKKLRTIR